MARHIMVDGWPLCHLPVEGSGSGEICLCCAVSVECMVDTLRAIAEGEERPDLTARACLDVQVAGEQRWTLT